MIRIAPLLVPILILAACGGARDGAEADATVDARHEASDPAFERRFNALQVEESKLLPQLTAPGEIPPAKRAELQREAAAILDGLRELRAEPGLTRSQAQRVETEISNLETMVQLYLPTG